MIYPQLLPCIATCYLVPMVRGSPNPKHFGLAARLKRARKQSGLTRRGLARAAGLSDSIIGYVETERHFPAVGKIAQLAAALSVSAAWLAYGLGEQCVADPAATCDGMGARLQAARMSQSQTKASLGRLADLSAPSIGQIENGGQAGVQTIEALATALHVSPAWLAYGVEPQALPARRRARTPEVEIVLE